MTTCRFVCNNEAGHLELTKKIWEAIKDWKEFSRKEVSLSRTTGKEGEFYVYLSIEDKVKVSVSVCFTASENTGKYYELILVKGEERRVLIPADVKASLYYQKADYE